MLNKFVPFFCLAVIVFSSCQKDLKTQQTAANSTLTANDQATAASALTGVVDTTNSWYGDYAGLFHNYPDVQDDDLIKKGVAQLPYLDRQFDFSQILYDMPAKYNIPGDSVSFEARVKNPKATAFDGYDVLLELTGEQHSAQVHFVGDAAYTSYTSYSVGNARDTGLTELVHYFGVFQDLKLLQKNYSTSIYINNNLVYKFKYGVKNSIGRVKSLGITFKGYGTCTKTGLKNSFTRAPILLEDFNIDGQSNTIYY